MLINPPKPFLSRRGPASRPAALTLVAADYEDATLVRLTFDRPIDIGALDGRAIVVNDGLINNRQYLGTAGASLLAPDRVEVLLTDAGPFPGGDLRLDAGPDTGIVALSDRAPWPGAQGLLMPFP